MFLHQRIEVLIGLLQRASIVWSAKQAANAVGVEAQDAEQTRRIEAHVGLNAFVHKKRSLHRANMPPKPNHAPGRIIEAALIWKTKHERSRSRSKPSSCPHRHTQPSWEFL